jgi:hypothetical protein
MLHLQLQRRPRRTRKQTKGKRNAGAQDDQFKVSLCVCKMVTGLFELCITVFSEIPRSEQEQLYPRMKADEVKKVVLSSTDTLITAFCKTMWQTPNREELKIVLTSFFKVCQPCFCIFHELKLLAQDTSVEIWDTHGPGSHAF